MRIAMSVMGLSLCLAGGSLAQGGVKPTEGERPCLPEQVGTWTPNRVAVDGGRQYGLTDAQSRLVLGKLDRLVADLRALPAFNPALGIRTEVSRDFCCPFYCQRQKACGSQPAYARLWMLLPYYEQARSGAPVTDPENRAEIEFTFNNPGTIFNSSAITLRDGRRAAFAPIPFREVNGVMLYRNQSGSDLYAFVSRGNRPLWVPVSRQAYLETLLAQRDSIMAENTKGLTDPKMLEMVRSTDQYLGAPVRAQLKALSPAERTSQAWVSTSDELLRPAGSPDARPLVVYNPDYVDRARPRTDIQFIVVRLEGLDLESGLPPPPRGRPFDLISRRLRYCSDVAGLRLWELAHQIDWSRIRALMD